MIKKYDFEINAAVLNAENVINAAAFNRVNTPYDVVRLDQVK